MKGERKAFSFTFKTRLGKVALEIIYRFIGTEKRQIVKSFHCNLVYVGKAKKVMPYSFLIRQFYSKKKLFEAL